MYKYIIISNDNNIDIVIHSINIIIIILLCSLFLINYIISMKLNTNKSIMFQYYNYVEYYTLINF